ncbi:hypothetical protein CHUAL_005919 [Chamberlinius hualienensis]
MSILLDYGLEHFWRSTYMGLRRKSDVNSRGALIGDATIIIGGLEVEKSVSTRQHFVSTPTPPSSTSGGKKKKYSTNVTNPFSSSSSLSL